MPVKQWSHGSVLRYWQGCRCDECRAANNAYVAGKRQAKREAENPFPNSPQWMISRSLSRKRTSHFGSFGSVRKSVYGIAKATPGIVGESLVLSYWDEANGGWRVAWKIAEGTRIEDLPWRKQ